MRKNNFSRARIHDENIKTVVLRLDYSGVVESTKLVELFSDNFHTIFKTRNEIFNNAVSFQLRPDELKDISESLSIPVNVIQKEKIYRFSGMKNVMCNVSIDISQYYIAMTINNCKNYEGLDVYVSPFKGAISIFMDKIKYFQPKRLGIRKIRVKDYLNDNSIHSEFKEEIFFSPKYTDLDSKVISKEYFDCFELPDKNNVKVNVRRIYHPAVKKEATEERDIIQCVLDIDTYYQDEKLNEINKLIDQGNSIENEVYQECMQYDFLVSIYK